MRSKFILLILVLSISINLYPQCPDLPNNTTANGSSNTTINICGSDDILFEVNDLNLPSGTIDWYQGNSPGFDPLSSGTLLGSSNITSGAGSCAAGGCPEIEMIFLDACGTEALNEYIVVSTGSGFMVDQLGVDFDMNNNGVIVNDDINTGQFCNWQDGDISVFSGCNNLVSVGPGDNVPPGSLLIIQTSNLASTNYGIFGLCGADECIYVVQNTCDRSIGAFSNCTGTTPRTQSISLTCGCSDALTYDRSLPECTDTDGTYVFSDGTFGNNACASPTVTANPFSNNSTTTNFTYSTLPTDCGSTTYIKGILNSPGYNEGCCGMQMTEEYEISVSCPMAQLTGGDDLCPGECTTISTGLQGGESPYNLNLTLSAGVFPIPINIPSIPVNQDITICFDTGGPIFDITTFTINVPNTAAGFSGSLTLNGFTDNNGCTGTVDGGSVALSFNDAPSINTPADLEACDLGNGNGLFILTDLVDEINGGSGATVIFYLDMAGTIPLSSPFETPSTTIYAQIEGNPCDSDIVPVGLVVLTNGDAGLITVICNTDGNPSNMCDICDDDGVDGEDVTIEIIFENPSLNYDYEISISNSSGTSMINGSGFGSAFITQNINETTTFQLISVTADGDCPDNTDLGDVITIHYSIEPQFDDPGDLSDCAQVILPNFNGSGIPSNIGYYPNQLGQGIPFMPGDIITSSMTLYLYGGILDCDLEYEITIDISGSSMIDDPADVSVCGSFVLPPITGTNLDNPNYYTEINGGGSIVSVGTIISNDIILYLFDPLCGTNQPELNIEILPGPSFTNETDTSSCAFYILPEIEGTDLSGGEGYFSLTGGNGTQLMMGDTIFADSTIFIFDTTLGCQVEVPITISIGELSNPGIDTSLLFCFGEATSLNFMNTVQTTTLGGTWIDDSNTGVIVDSTDVDLSTLSTGQYTFEYRFEDLICGDTSAMIDIEIIDTPNAGIDAGISICQDTTGVNIFDLLGNPNENGIFTDGIDIASFDPTNASFSADVEGTTNFLYIVGDESSSCGADTSFFSVEVLGSSFAGMDALSSICGDSLLQLLPLLPNADTGMFEDPSSSGGLNIDGTFDTSLVPDGSFTILHIVQGNGGCPSDTAFINIVVSDSPSAGDENSAMICGDETIDLLDLINGDPGGVFFQNGSMISSTIIDDSGVNMQQDYLYITGDGSSCPLDTAIISIAAAQQPTFAFDLLDQNLCNECTTLEINVNTPSGSSNTAFISISDQNGFEFNTSFDFFNGTPMVNYVICPLGNTSGDLELPTDGSFTLALDSISSGDCVFQINATFDLSVESDVTFDLQQTLCDGSMISVGADIYDINNPTGSTTLVGQAQNGCDSIVNVMLAFEDFNSGMFQSSFCNGDSITVLGITYSETFMGDTLLIGASNNGCDSLITITIEVTDEDQGNFSNFICDGDTIDINGMIFTESIFDFVVDLPGEGTNGCDSSVVVNLVKLENEEEEINGTFCSSFELMIDGQVFNAQNPSGTIIVEGAATTGCDSIYNVNLDFSGDAIDSTFILTTCDEGFFILIGDVTFNRTNTQGEVTLPALDANSCDTIITVDLTFGEMIIDYEVFDADCITPEEGTVVINDINGVPPYNLIFGGNNAIVNDLPFELELQFGTGTISITDAGGCMGEFDYEIQEGEAGEFEFTQTQDQIIIFGGEPDSIVWMPTDGLSCTDCLDPFVDVDETTQYNAVVFYGDSCQIAFDIEFIFDNDIDDYILPNVFSPNNDGQNDNFTLFITEGAIGTPTLMRIYDRWGNLMFVENDSAMITSTGWDGSRNGVSVENGVYVYQVVVEENGVPINLYGDLTVIR